MSRSDIVERGQPFSDKESRYSWKWEWLDFVPKAAGMDEVDYDLYPDKDYQVKWLRRYLQFDFTAKGRSPQDVTDIDVERLYVQTNKCACAAHFFWSLWALIQAKNSSIDFDFLGYSITRLSEYTRRKKEFFPLALP